MDEPQLAPFGCRHCGVPRGNHGQRWWLSAGMHAWEQPTERQILVRMRYRRAFRLESK